jgi:4-hydroxy-tetrahydrodipicolinate synthase
MSQAEPARRAHPPGRFGAVVCAMATPFKPDGTLDVPGATRLARWLVDNGNDSLVLAGTTGEGPTMTDAEKVELWTAVRAAVSVPLIAGTGTASTAHSIELTKAAAEVGADGALVVVPYYNRPSQAGIDAHFRAVASATDLPVLLYDIPKRTGREVKTATLVQLATDGVIAGVKDAAGSPPAAAALAMEAPAGFEIYSGDDAMTLPLLAVGAVGVISVASHWAGVQISEMIASFSKGDTDAAVALNERLVESWEFQTSDAAPNPVPTKAMLRALGLPAGECRLPMGPTPAGLEDKARQVWSNLHLRPFPAASLPEEASLGFVAG